MSRRLLIGFLLLVMTACNSPATPTEETEQEPDFSSFINQTVNWEACDLRGQDPNIQAAVSQFLADRLECAIVQTPLDWANPDLDSVNLGLYRVKASDSALRKGAIAINPGGPGGDSLGQIVDLGQSFGVRDTENPVDDLFRQLSEQYDLIGFSPRGVGASFRLTCDTDKVAEPPRWFEDRSEENIAKILAEAKQVADACTANPLSKYVSTEQTVQDMDLIRILLGDEKLNYLGYSYGTWLGAWYAKRFPENAGNMVLDSSLDFSKGPTSWVLGERLATERAFKDIISPYIARNATNINLGASNEEVYQVYRAFSNDMKAVSQVSGFSNSAFAQEYLLSLFVESIVDGILKTQAATATMESVIAELQTITFIEGAPAEVNQELFQRSVAVVERFAGLQASFAAGPQPLELPSSRAVFTAIKCNDGVWNQDPQAWVTLGNELNALYPHKGGGITSEPCAFWGSNTSEMPDVPANMPPLLVVQSEFDARTPAEGALEAFSTLSNAGLVFIENELTHALFPYGTRCVDEPVATYLLTGELPTSKQTNCQAKPLPGETVVFPVEDTTSPNAPTLRTQELAPQKVKEIAFESIWYDRFHDAVRKNSENLFNALR